MGRSSIRPQILPTVLTHWRFVLRCGVLTIRKGSLQADGPMQIIFSLHDMGVSVEGVRTG